MKGSGMIKLIALCYMNIVLCATGERITLQSFWRDLCNTINCNKVRGSELKENLEDEIVKNSTTKEKAFAVENNRKECYIDKKDNQEDYSANPVICIDETYQIENLIEVKEDILEIRNENINTEDNTNTNENTNIYKSFKISKNPEPQQSWCFSSWFSKEVREMCYVGFVILFTFFLILVLIVIVNIVFGSLYVSETRLIMKTFVHLHRPVREKQTNEI